MTDDQRRTLQLDMLDKVSCFATYLVFFFDCCIFFFFFSSRRRHTRFDCDWSSDVCSSDLDEEDWDRIVTQWSPETSSENFLYGSAEAWSHPSVSPPFNWYLRTDKFLTELLDRKSVV